MAGLNGIELLNDAIANRGTAFTLAERRARGLEGLLPPSVETIDRQLERVLGHLASKPNDLERYIYLVGLCDRNETLFYKTLMSDPARFVPIVYDPTVAEACLTFGHIYRRPRGMYITREMKGRMAEVLRNWPRRDVRFICVSTGGRILGLGDIGANGMGIPIGKLQLYTACAAVPPDPLLPVLFDIGTTNAALRADPLYLGLRAPPPATDDEVDALADEFVAAANEVFPGVCIHFEDWKGTDAIRLLARYKDKYLVFNDDIQGTASVALAGLMTALEIIRGRIRDQRVFFLGAGSAGTGIANMIVEAMVGGGATREDARARITLFDVNGLIESSRKDLNPSQKPYAHRAEPTRDLVKAIEAAKPTILIGVSTTGGAFTRPVIELMAKLNPRPIIFPLSNPTEKSECTPEQAYSWSGGRALVACGVQFPDVKLDGKTYHPGQANNFYIFPAIALAVYATHPSRITDLMFLEAARATADQVGSDDRDHGMLFPKQSDILAAEIATATDVAEVVFAQGLTTVPRPNDVKAWIESLTWKPRYEEPATREVRHRLAG
jgi:malate dehydrogenase (oxaloacetate-decarboxylating)(NADP+)